MLVDSAHLLIASFFTLKSVLGKLRLRDDSKGCCQGIRAPPPSILRRETSRLPSLYVELKKKRMKKRMPVVWRIISYSLIRVVGGNDRKIGLEKNF